MVRIKMTTLSAGPRGVRPVGWEGDVTDSEARDLIAGRYAVALRPRGEPTTKPKHPQAVKPRGEKRVKK